MAKCSVVGGDIRLITLKGVIIIFFFFDVLNYLVTLKLFTCNYSLEH